MPHENRRPKRNYIIHGVGVLLELLSGEYLLTKRRYPNGGTVVFIRAGHVTLILFFGALALLNWLDPQRGRAFSFYELRMQIITHVTWIGALFAAVYALLYARFSSQWTYLAGMYNEIKASQVRKDTDVTILAEWKAAYIEDCDDLHLLRKRMFASTAYEWLKADDSGQSLIKENFKNHTLGGERRLKRIEFEVAEIVDRENART